MKVRDLIRDLALMPENFDLDVVLVGDEICKVKGVEIKRIDDPLFRFSHPDLELGQKVITFVFGEEDNGKEEKEIYSI